MTEQNYNKCKICGEVVGVNGNVHWSCDEIEESLDEICNDRVSLEYFSKLIASYLKGIKERETSNDNQQTPL